MAVLLDLQPNAAFRPAHAIGIRVQHGLNSVLLKYPGDFFRNVRVLAGEQLTSRLDNGHATAEAAKHLPKLQADISASEDQQMLRNGVQLHDGSAVEKGYGLQAVEWGHRGTRTGVDEDLAGGECSLAAVPLPDKQGLGAGQTGFAEDQLKICRLLNAALAAIAKAVHDVALALADAFHVDADVAGVNAVISGPPPEVSDAGAGDHGLGGSASLVDAGAADMLALDESGAHAGFSQGSGKRCTALSGADHNGIELLRS